MPVLSPTPSNIAKACDALEQGELVIFPTETVLGLGADARNPRAISKVFACKQRPAHNPLIVHCQTSAEAQRLGIFNAAAKRLADKFWPGPLSLVVPRRARSGVAKAACAGLSSMALRVPAHPVAQTLLHAFAHPIAAPSANPSGYLSPTRLRHIPDVWRRDMIVLRESPAQEQTRLGLESTILSCLGTTPQVLRLGSLTQHQMESCLNIGLQDAPTEPAEAAKLSPGRLLRHYAPHASLRLNASHVRKHEALLAFGQPLAHSGMMKNLSTRADLEEASANFFAALHWLDARTSHIAVQPIPDTGLGIALNDRLRRAAHSAPKGQRRRG